MNFGAVAFRGTEALEFKILPTNAFGELDETTVDAVDFQLRQRAQRPLLPVYRGGLDNDPPWFCENKVRNPSARPDDQVTDFICTRPTTGGYAYSHNGRDTEATITFLERNRTSGRIALRGDPSVAFEEGTRLRISWSFGNGGYTSKSLDRLSEGVYRVEFDEFGEKRNVQIWAERNGLGSWEILNFGDIRFARTPGRDRTRLSGDTHGGGP